MSIKTVGRSGSSFEYTIFSETSFMRHFIHQGIVYEQHLWNGRCYRLDEPGGVHSRLEREGGMAHRQISTALFDQLLKECEERIAEAEKRGAA